MNKTRTATNRLPIGGQCYSSLGRSRDESSVGESLATSSSSSSSSSSSCRWLAVPYAEPIKTRFAPSVPRKNFALPDLSSTTISNDGWGPECYQWDDGTTTEQSEDCLTLNIWAPNNDDDDDDIPSSKKPVMVFIHGGGFLIGSASGSLAAYGFPGDPSIKLYDGSQLAARQDVVVVVIQYRLGPFGFLPMLEQEEEERRNFTTTGGSNGLGDQISALKWVRLHIDRFGGDPNNVTVFGHSSGSVSVCALLHSPAAEGLFQRAIMQSGGCYPSIDMTLTKEEAISFRDDYVQKMINYDDDDSFDLYTAPAEEVVRRTLDIYGGTWVNAYLAGLGAPSVDGEILPDLPINLKPHRGVDVMVGVTSFDQTVSSIPNGGRETFLSNFGLSDHNSETILDSYAEDDDLNLFQDACLRCQSQRVLERAIEAGGAATGSLEGSMGQHYYWYTFDCPKSAAIHGTDIVAVFGSIDYLAYKGGWQEIMGPPPSGELIERMQAAWASFARSGNPDWEDVTAGESSDGITTGAFIGCDATTMIPLINEFGTCDIWTSAADSVGEVSVGKICMQDSYLEGQEDQSSDQSVDGDTRIFHLVAIIILVALVIVLPLYLLYNRRRRSVGYSAIGEVPNGR